MLCRILLFFGGSLDELGVIFVGVLSIRVALLGVYIEGDCFLEISNYPPRPSNV